MYTTQKQVRDLFWGSHPSLEHQAREAGTLTRPHNKQCATVRCAFVEFVDQLQRAGSISDALARRVTL